MDARERTEAGVLQGGVGNGGLPKSNPPYGFATVAMCLAVLFAPLVAQAADNSDCISDRRIVSRDVPDDSTIIFHLRGGQVWKNTLKTRCFGLKDETEGLTYQPTDPATEELCSNQVTIHLNSFRSFCQLGNFTRLK